MEVYLLKRQSLRPKKQNHDPDENIYPQISQMYADFKKTILAWF